AIGWTPAGRSHQQGLRRQCDWLRALFFFSSRRRHTRSKRDWSSDVCSSDLGNFHPQHVREFPLVTQSHPTVCERIRQHWLIRKRSEERRVGKESRSRGRRRPSKEDMKGRECDVQGEQAGKWC